MAKPKFFHCGDRGRVRILARVSVLALLGCTGSAWAQTPPEAPSQGNQQGNQQGDADPNQTADPAAEAPNQAQPGQAEAAPAEAAPGQDLRPMPPPPPRAGGTSNAAGTGYAPYQAQNYQQPAYYPPPPPRGDFRLVSFTLGVGPGALALHDDLGTDSEPALSYALRLGFGIAPNWQIQLAIEGASADRGGSRFSQNALTVGVQNHIVRWLYWRVAFGGGEVSEDTGQEIYVDDRGLALGGAIGVELLQTENVAMGLELAGTNVTYPNESWRMGGINFVLSLF